MTAEELATPDNPEATQLERLSFCQKCGKPFERDWIESFQKWSRVCYGCLLEMISNPEADK